MEKSDFLELNLLQNNDYAGHWDVPVNDSFRIIDAEAEEVATELLTTPANGYNGKLKGTAASLEARLNVAMDNSGAIKFNNDDLEISRYSRIPYADPLYLPSNIHSRIQRAEESRTVSDSLKDSIQNAGGNTKEILSLHDRNSATDNVMNQRYASISGIDDFHFKHGAISSFFSYDNGTGIVSVAGLGVMQIRGEIYNHTRQFRLATTIGTNRYLTIWARNVYIPGYYDCQLIRNSVVTGNAGSATVSGEYFDSTGIGSFLGIDNNRWIPSSGQILRVSTGSRTYDYKIRTVEANRLKIYGKFEVAFSGCSWEVYDLTQPVFHVTSPILGNPADWTVMSNCLSTTAGEGKIPVALVHIDSSENFRVTSPFGSKSLSQFSKYELINPDYNENGKLGVDGTLTEWSTTLSDYSVGRIKSTKVIVLESWKDSAAPLSKKYYVTIDPTRCVPIGSPSLPYWLNSFKIAIRPVVGASSGSVIDFDPLNSCTIRLFHPDYADEKVSGGGAAASWWTSRTANEDALTVGYTYKLEYLGILVEFM